MAFQRVCAVDEIGDSGMAAFFLDSEVLVLRDGSGCVHAIDGTCPHEDFPLVHGDFDGTVVTCVNHQWCFDATTGKGINPPGARLTRFELKVDGDDVYVDPDAEVAP